MNSPQARLPQLDAVRGVAILLVIFHNTSSNFPALQFLFSNGWMGVDLFFVLSGFLITGILLETRQSEHYLRNFYARRCLRIWPLYYAVLLFMFVAIPLLRPSEAATVFEARSSPWWAYPLFLQNFLVAVPTKATGPLGVTWSLGVEEQFYFIWPWILRALSNAQLRWMALAVICASPILRLLLSLHGLNIYSASYCRLDGLMAGALLALLIREPHFDPRRFTKTAWIMLPVAALLALITAAFRAQWIVMSFSVVAAASFIYLALFSTQRLLRAALTNRFLVYTGIISYGLYLLHKIPFDAERALHLGSVPSLALPLGIAASYLLAAASWNFLEKPCLSLKRFFPNEKRAAGLHQRPLT